MNEHILSCNMRGKMEDMDSLSTSCAVNPICKVRIENAIEIIRQHSEDARDIIDRYLLPSDDKRHLTEAQTVKLLQKMNVRVCVCIFCYAQKALRYRETNSKKFAKNGEFLVVERSMDELPSVNPRELQGLKPFRLEAMGDLINVAHAKNYLKMCVKNGYADFALWTKNPHLLWGAVLEVNGKPKNLQCVLSSFYIDRPDEVVYWKYNRMCMEKFGYPLFDKLFTVWTESGAKEKNVQFNCCGADGMKDRKCKNCLNCYKRENYNEFVNELLR